MRVQEDCFEEAKDFFPILKHLDETTEPNYDYINFLFAKIIMNSEISPSDNFMDFIKTQENKMSVNTKKARKFNSENIMIA